MQSSLDSALSGLSAASQRVTVAADNIANVRSTAVTEVKRGGERRNATEGRRPTAQPVADRPVVDPAPARSRDARLERGPSAAARDRATRDPDRGGESVEPAADEARFQPVRAEQISIEPAGVRVVARPVNPPSVREFQPSASDANSDGTVARPNVSLEREFTDLAQAQRAYEASLKMADTVDRMLGTFLDSEL